MFDDDGSESGSSGMDYFCAFYLRFDDSVGSVSCLGSGVFASIGFESKCNSSTFSVFVPIPVDPKGGLLIKMFWCSNSLFYFQI